MIPIYIADCYVICIPDVVLPVPADADISNKKAVIRPRLPLPRQYTGRDDGWKCDARRNGRRRLDRIAASQLRVAHFFAPAFTPPFACP